MKNTTYTPTTKAHPRFAPTLSRAAPNTNTRKAAPDWKPQPCGLTRSELRKIVGDILG